MGRNYYSILEINRNATDVDIKKAYRWLALKHHPSSSSHAHAAELAEAFDLLSNPHKKATYDKFGEEGLKGGIPSGLGVNGAWSSGYVYHGNADEMFRQFFGGDNPFAALNGFSVEVETLDGRLLDIVHPQYTKVVTGEGMPLVNNPSKRGDLIIHVITHFPEKLSPEKKQLLKQALSHQNSSMHLKVHSVMNRNVHYRN